MSASGSSPETWRLSFVGGPFDGVDRLVLGMPTPPKELLLAVCWSHRACELQLDAEMHPHPWYWLVGERSPPDATRYRLTAKGTAGGEPRSARYLAANVLLPKALGRRP